MAVQPAVVVRATGLYVQRRALGGLLAAFVSLLLLLALMPAAAWADYPTFTSWATQNVGDREISRISTMSDVHFGESNTRERFRALLIEMADFQPEMLIVTGDTFTTSYSQPSSGFWPDGVGSSFTSSYDEITRAAHHYLGDIPVVIAAGNHDYDAGGGYYTTNSGFSSYYGLVPTKNVDVFLFGASSASWTFTQAQLDGLGEYLAGRADKDKPVFIPSHYPIDDPSANQNGEHGGATNSAAAASVLAAGGDHPIFYLWGHSHQRADNRSVIGQLFQHYPSGYTTMNAGAINYRIPTTSAQGVNMTIDRASDPDRLVADVVRVSITTTPATVTQIGTYTQ
ncbi:MAG TPA: metallophosphoesterase, partial [Thermoleophilia bacterium]|nr:metallophosphoesterase [Thermoleophilia bacterium]